MSWYGYKRPHFNSESYRPSDNNNQQSRQMPDHGNKRRHVNEESYGNKRRHVNEESYHGNKRRHVNEESYHPSNDNHYSHKMSEHANMRRDLKSETYHSSSNNQRSHNLHWHSSNSQGLNRFPNPNRQLHYGRYKPDLDVVAISKYLAFILRHPKKDSKLQMDKEGYIYVNDILNNGKYRGRLELLDILSIVENNDKRRFSVKQDCYGYYMIRATQGHSVEVNLHLEPITNPNHFPTVVHGTTYEAWKFICTEGLKRMNRTYIHFAKGVPGDSNVISGMRNTSEIYIFINLRKALNFGIEFFLSENMVILSKGDAFGIIPPTFFHLVLDRKTSRVLLENYIGEI